jgi:CubicO group peptidase (beta-lactamase class C family)
MMKVLLLFCLSLLLALNSCKKSADDNPAVLPSPPAGRDFSPLTQIVQSNLTQLGGNAGLDLLYKDGTVLYKQYFGSWNDNTYIPVASGSKWPSMATVMSLVDAGLLNLNDKVSQHYPLDYAATDRKDITLRQLMSHGAGFAGGSSWISSDDINLQQATKGIGVGGTIGTTPTNAVGMPYAPAGSQFAYGGVSMHVAGGVAEKVTGKSWDVLFRERIADPCGMPATNYTALGVTTNYRIAGGAGTRMMEYANFLLMLLNEGRFNGQQVLSAASVAEILKDQTGGVPIGFTPYSGDAMRQGYRYGLGCWIEGYKNGQPSEFGDQGAFGFSPWVDKGRNVIGVFFVQRSLGAVNTQPTVDSAPYTLLRKKVAEILDK